MLSLRLFGRRHASNDSGTGRRRGKQRACQDATLLKAPSDERKARSATRFVVSYLLSERRTSNVGWESCPAAETSIRSGSRRYGSNMIELNRFQFGPVIVHRDVVIDVDHRNAVPSDLLDEFKRSFDQG